MATEGTQPVPAPPANPPVESAVDGHGRASHGAAQAATPKSARPLRRWLLLGGGILAVVAGLWYGIPTLLLMLNTVSTDDAYVNAHVTFVAPRVAGQVKRVLVDDNFRVRKGDVLVELDKEPFEVQVAIKKAAVETAEADLVAAQAKVRGQVAQARGNRFKLEHAIEDVNTQIANLRANVAVYHSKKATLDLARANLKRGEALAPSGGISKEDLDQRKQAVRVGEAATEQALETVHANRVSLGLVAEPEKGDHSQVPADLDQNFSSVRQALAEMLQSAAQVGIFPTSYNLSPKQAIAEFYQRDPAGDLDRIYAKLMKDAPAVRQAEAKLHQARRDLAQAELDLKYTNVVSDIDGVVTRRNVNPGNFVQVGQNLMAIRSLTEIWIDANFKETQLADLRIGQRVRIETDTYGSKHEYEGRITGFTMGTGQTLALLPPQNATGNFVKIVQRLPVRVELTNYDPDRDPPLFVGISVVPYVYYKEAPAGPHAGAFLQPPASLPQHSPTPKP